jgi:acetyl-CoA carboxylase biotin carboxyl carrier protein
MSESESREPSLDDVARMIELLREGGWREATLRMGDFELHVSDGTAAVAPASPAPELAAATPQATAPAGSPAATPQVAASPASSSAPDSGRDTSNDLVITADSLGVFWRSPQPGAPPFVEVGDDVTAESPVGIVEVMKMMTRVLPGQAGTVVAIHVDNGELVEFGQALVTIATA